MFTTSAKQGPSVDGHHLYRRSGALALGLTAALSLPLLAGSAHAVEPTRVSAMKNAGTHQAATSKGCAAGPAADAPPAESPGVDAWIRQQARPLRSLELDAPTADLAWLTPVIGSARVVGLGESTHGSHEQFQVKRRLLRELVTRYGFRTLALEEDFANGVLIDEYLLTGRGDPAELLRDSSSPFWPTHEILQVLEWMRAWNRIHDDKVRFLGTDLLQLRSSSFTAVKQYVATHAPDQVDQVRADLHELRIRPDQFDWYRDQSPEEKERLIDIARRVSEVVDNVDAPRPATREYPEQHARAILGWYVNYAENGDFRGHRERFIADTNGWWQRLQGGKVAYWAANVHTAAARELTNRVPWGAVPGTWAGGHLERRLGPGYVSIGTWFGAGEITSPWWEPAPQRIGPARTGMLEYTLDRAHDGNYGLDLTKPAPPEVQSWLTASHTMRVILPTFTEDQDGNDYSMTVPNLCTAFDAALYLPTTTSSHLLTSKRE